MGQQWTQNRMNYLMKSDIYYNHLLMVFGMSLVILTKSDQVRIEVLAQLHSQFNYAITGLQIQDFT
jgi:hypothetical protein